MDLTQPAQPQYLTSSCLEVDPRLVLEVATGLEDPAAIAARYGFEDDRWESLKEFKPFRHAVDAKRAELQQSGYTFKMKAALAAEDLLSTVYKKALSSDTHIKDQLETLKYVSKLASLEPVANAAAQPAGAGFSLTINIPGGGAIQINQSAQATPEPIDVTPDPLVDNSDMFYDE